MHVLVGDIGGTSTRLARASVIAGRIELSAVRRYASAESPTLAAILRRYLDETGITCEVCEVAALAVAGPVYGDRCKTTNLPWELDGRELERELGLPRVRLLNDLEAVAWAVPVLEPTQLETLYAGVAGDAGEPATGNACVIAAGTGLGVAGCYWDGARHHAFATEAGHADFAPRTEQQFALLRHLQRRLRQGRLEGLGTHVSWERVVSGQGIVNLYEFLLVWHGASNSPALQRRLDHDDPAAAIAEAAAARTCPLCVEAMDLFVSLFARVIANQALSHMALGGVYLGGGVTLNNRELLGDGFIATILDSGRMTPVLERIPVRVIVEPNVALFGAAEFAVA